MIAAADGARSPLRTTHMRDPYGPPILFGSKSFMDEVAAATNTDPIEFRLRYLTNAARSRRRQVPRAEKYGWDARPSPAATRRGTDESRVGRGIAFRRHFGTYIALIAEVTGAPQDRRDRDPPLCLRP